MAVRRASAPLNYGCAMLCTGGNDEVFQQRAYGQLTGMAVQIIDYVFTGIEAVYQNVLCPKHFEAPRLSIVSAGCPAGEVQNAFKM